MVTEDPGPGREDWLASGLVDIWFVETGMDSVDGPVMAEFPVENPVLELLG